MFDLWRFFQNLNTNVDVIALIAEIILILLYLNILLCLAIWYNIQVKARKNSLKFLKILVQWHWHWYNNNGFLYVLPYSLLNISRWTDSRQFGVLMIPDFRTITTNDKGKYFSSVKTNQGFSHQFFLFKLFQILVDL